MKENIGTVQYASLLFDFYGDMLGESQSEIMTLYHEDNLSLAEIAEELGTSRQAVHYTLKKAESTLEKYEEKLGLLKTYNRNQGLAQTAVSRCEDLINSGSLTDKQIEELKTVIDTVREISE